MNLKTRFFLLILGTVLIPNIIIAMIVGFSFGGIGSIHSLHVQMRKYGEIVDLLKEPVREDDLEEILSDLPEGVEYYTLRNQDDNSVPSIRMQVIPFSYTDGSRAALFIHLPVFEKYSVIKTTPFQIVAPLVLLSVLTILSLGVIHSINNSLKRIEEATRKVAEGNYDFELPVKGNDSIASLSGSFNAMVKQVREEYSRRSRFFMGVSHDLKTPLTSISGYADAILEGYAEDRETLQKYTGIIKSKSQLLLERITHLIQFVKLETGDWQSSFRSVSFKKFLEEIVDVTALDAELYGHRFIADVDIPENLAVYMDEELVRRSLDNIIHNAFRYAEDKSVIELRAYTDQSNTAVSVSNTGAGIPEEDLKYIFEPFYRGSSGRNEEGFGLGLANVAAVIKSHKWEIKVTSVPGGKTEFIILIPVK